jgi:ketosteroid isomerase-like protein
MEVAMATSSPMANDATSFGDETQLVELSKRWSAAINGHDRAMLEELMAPEFVLHKWDNTRNIARAVWFDFLFNHIKISEFEQTAIVAHAYGDIGVVTSKFPITRGTFDDKPMGELHGYLMDVWRRANGHWQVVSRTSADLPGREGAPEATTQKNP